MMDQSLGHEAQTVHRRVWRKALPDLGTCTQRRGAVGAAGLALSVLPVVLVDASAVTSDDVEVAAAAAPSVAILRNDVDRAVGLVVRYESNLWAMPLGIMSMVSTLWGRVDEGSMRCIMSSAAGKAAFREAVTARGRWMDWPFRDAGVLVEKEGSSDDKRHRVTAPMPAR